MNDLSNFFKNKFIINKDNINILDIEDKYTSNFGKQWKEYNSVQIDSINNFQISKNFLEKIIFSEIKTLKGKNILEIGCGAGRFTEYLAPISNKCVSVDLSSAIFYNVAITNSNLILVKADFLKLISKNKFDVVICRGVLQHTPDPYKSILKLFEFISSNGYVYFDIYPMPKIGLLHPKYFFWRPVIKLLFSYEKFELYLKNNIKTLLKIKRIIKKIFFKSNFISDLFIPVWDYEGKINLDKLQLEKWSIMDTLDGIFAKYDKPISNYNVIKFLKNNNIKIIKNDKKNNIFMTQIK